MLYLTALGKEATDQTAAEQLYVRATALDPSFALAYARASLLNSEIATYQEARARRAKARAQAEEALRLAPTLGEAHMALALCFYMGEKKYDAALKEFERAAAASPNNAEIYTYIGGIYRRQGRWHDALASFERALSLDPRNARIAFRSAMNHVFIRDWSGAAGDYKRALESAPENPDSKVGLAYLEVVQNNNPAAGRNILQNIPPGADPDYEPISMRWDLAMLERDYAGAEKILADAPAGGLVEGPKTFYEGRTALARGDGEAAQRYFAAAKPAFEEAVHDDPADASHHASLGVLYAYMHRKEEAIREARRAVEMEPESQDAFHGALGLANLALVDALVGEEDQAITLIEGLLSTPGAASWPNCHSSITLAELRLRWEWDSLRSNPRFQRILAGPEPATILTTPLPAPPAVPEKSIAVLPFENLGGRKDNSDFGAGIQDDVLTSLAQIHDLKVISRTSVMAYEKPNGRNIREIGRALGVANVLEGTVRREGNRVLINVQLIDARNDRHLWAERYDRTVADSIGLQGELATQIAAALKATLAPEEKARLDVEPTANSEAYVLYLTALGKEATDEIAAEQLYVQATTLDPKFALAYARASLLNSELANYQQSSARKAKARAQAEEALRLSPTLGEAHMALGLCLYLGEKNYDSALKEFEVAAAASPNNAGSTVTSVAFIGGRDAGAKRWPASIALSRLILATPA